MVLLCYSKTNRSVSCGVETINGLSNNKGSRYRSNLNQFWNPIDTTNTIKEVIISCERLKSSGMVLNVSRSDPRITDRRNRGR